jgi:hypothetical protein
MASRKWKSAKKRNTARYNPGASSLSAGQFAPRTIQDKREAAREREADKEAREAGRYCRGRAAAIPD